MNNNIHTGSLLRNIKRNQTWHPGVPEKYGLRSWLKFIFLLFFLTGLYLCASAQKVSLDIKAKPLKEVLQSLRKQSGYAFVYNDQVIAKARPVTISVKDKDLKEVLPLIFRGQALDYEINGKVITVIENKTIQQSQIKDRRPIRGKIIDSLGQPLANVTVKIKETGQVSRSNEAGGFHFEDVPEGSVISFSLLGYGGREISGIYDGIIVSMNAVQGMLTEAVVNVNTGYQSIPKERATGSFVIIDSAILNRRVSTNILDRLDGVTSGMYFNGLGNLDIPSQLPNDRLGINIRGESSILSSKDPLVVVDNFPYSGELKNINPNDVETITILKDAAAASIWGARAGNGVIVITTKKGKLNTRMQVTFNSSITTVAKPDLYNVRNALTPSQYIEVEKFLFEKGLFNQDLLNKTAQTPVSPVVEILDRKRSGIITESEANEQIAAYEKNDVRDDFNKYVYRTGAKQQYSLALRGGNNNLSYSLSAGVDHNLDQVKRNGYDRKTINLFNNYSPVKNLEITFGLNYSNSTTELNNTSNTYGNVAYGVGGRYTKMLPYSRLIEDSGAAAAILKGYKPSYIEEMLSKGFKDWSYRPLNEIRNANNEIRINNILMRAGIKYRFTNYLNAEVQYANEYQVHKNPSVKNSDTYYARNLMNRYAQLEPGTGRVKYIFPEGGIYSESNAEWRNSNFRGQLNIEKDFGDHLISALTGVEVREQRAKSSSIMLYGYDEQFGTSIANLDYKSFYPTQPSGSATLPIPTTGMSEQLERYISYYANIGYQYKNKYLLTVSARKDGSNIFGVNTNNRITPLMSAGIGWIISKENFFQTDIISYLKLRGSYGYNGNLRNTSAYLSGMYFTNPLTGFPYISIFTPPNPELRWEKVRNINFGLDFGLKNNIINGTLEIYNKHGFDLLQETPLAGQTGFSSYISNAAEMRTKGVDLTLNVINLNGALRWNTTLLLSGQKDKVLSYDPKPNATIVSGGTPVVGYPLNNIFSYYWEGLDPANGDPMGRLNGIVNKDYASINNNISPDSLKFHGSRTPQIYGSFRNDFSYKGFNLSFNLTYKFGYFFRRASASLNYTDVLGLYQHADYAQRWQNPGDELTTSVPSLVYPSNSRRNTFYKYSEVLVEPGDHIRLQDIRLGYNMSQAIVRKLSFRRIEVFSYAQNIGIIWRKNKLNLDPDNPGVIAGTLVDIKTPLNLTFGIIGEF